MTGLGLSDRLMQNLPAQFLTLVVLNVAFLGALLWFLSDVDARRVAFEETEAASRERVLPTLLAACTEQHATTLHDGANR